jgi:hypothetical protein
MVFPIALPSFVCNAAMVEVLLSNVPGRYNADLFIPFEWSKNL